ncbi:FtsX-like permease family protein [Actinacidiphila glaucinigra]|uniref:FtsX-like permease family protein n=1 Tax=Actinacidiphila glaucinigra TaxID=235986 RepID=UPI0037C8671A
MAALVLVTAFLAAALPRTVDAYEDAALRDTLRQASLPDRSVSATAEVPYTAVAAGDVTDPFPARDLAAAETAFLKVVRPPLTLDPAQAVLGVRNAEPVPASDPGLPRPTSSLDPRATLVAQPGLGTYARVVSGRLPGGTTRAGEVEAVLSARTAQVLGLRTGSAVHLPTTSGSPLTVRVTGIVTPRSPGSAFWSAEPDLRSPTLLTVPGPSGADPAYYWHFSALISQEASGVVLGLAGGARLYWHHPVDVGTVTAHDVPALRDRLASLSSGPDSTRLRSLTGIPGISVTQNGLASLLGPFEREREAASPMVLVATLGVGAVAGVVLLMAGGLAAARRRSEVQWLRVRGSSRAALVMRLLGETAPIVLPSAAAGTALALLVVPAGRYGTSIAAGAVVAVVAALALPVRALVLSGRFGLQEREDLAEARPSRRRTVAELTVAVVVTAAVAALRRRGTADGGVDALTASAPVLVAVVAALVLLRLYPLPLRLLARPTARLRGSVLHLGLARAGRTSSAAMLPLVALLVALAVTSFGGSVLAGVETGRDRAAVRQVGADARIDSLTTLPAGLAEHVRKVAGVRATTSVRIETGLSTIPAGTSYDLVVVDPEKYAALVSATGIGEPFPARALVGGGDGVLPAIVSPRLAQQFRKSDAIVQAYSGPTPVRAVAVQDVTPAVTGRDFVIVSAAAMTRAHADKPAYLLAPTTLFATGPTVDGRGLNALARQSGKGLTLTLRAQERTGFTGSALQTGARRVYLAAVAGAIGYSVLALLLSLLHNAPQRKALLARLRTMGMTSRQRQWLAVLETLPQVLLGALGGILVSLATVSLLRPAVDLTALAFSSRASGADISGTVLRTDPASLLLPAAGLVVLAGVVLAVQAWLTGRRGEGTELRMGERS